MPAQVATPGAPKVGTTLTHSNTSVPQNSLLSTNFSDSLKKREQFSVSLRKEKKKKLLSLRRKQNFANQNFGGEMAPTTS